MDEKSPLPMTPLDTLVTTPDLQMLKLMIPYTPPANQRLLAIYVKFLEFQHTLSFFRNFTADLHTCAFEKELSSPLDMLEELRPFLPKKDYETLDMIANLMTMMDTFSTFRSMAGNDSSQGSGNDSDMLSLLMGMLSPKQQEMFEMYSAMMENSGGDAEQKKNPEEDEHDK